MSVDGVPLGLLPQAVWTRDPTETGKAATRRQRPITAKESGRWLTALAASQAVLPEDVAEEAPPEGAEPVCWRVLPTLPVPDAAAASEIVRLSTLRWLSERYHFVLKSGGGEELHLETRARLERALATSALVAWRLLGLTYLARQDPDAPGDRSLATHEGPALYGIQHHTPLPPASPPTLHDAVRWLAHRGGFLGRRHDGEPGVVVIWRGLRRRADIAAMWLLLSQPPPTPT